jgi:hypothetical protein
MVTRIGPQKNNANGLSAGIWHCEGMKRNGVAESRPIFRLICTGGCEGVQEIKVCLSDRR